MRLQATPGGTLQLDGDLDGKPVNLVKDYHNVGGPETLLLRLRGKRLTNLRLTLSGPQGGTGNLRAGRLDQRGGSGAVTAQISGFTLLRAADLDRR